MDILISNRAKKQFEALARDIQVIIKEAFIDLKEKGLNANLDIRKLSGLPNCYRIRIGDLRVKMEFEKPDKLNIYWIGKRSKAYNK